MGILDRILRNSFEAKAGRIRFFPNNYVFTYTEAQYQAMIKRNPRLYAAHKGKLLTHTDADGREAFLIHQRSVYCRNSELCEGKGYPRYEDDRGSKWWYPAKECRNCEHHKKAERRGLYRFPRCMFRASEKPGQEALKEMFGIVNNAVKDANEMMGIKAKGATE